MLCSFSFFFWKYFSLTNFFFFKFLVFWVCRVFWILLHFAAAWADCLIVYFVLFWCFFLCVFHSMFPSCTPYIGGVQASSPLPLPLPPLLPPSTFLQSFRVHHQHPLFSFFFLFFLFKEKLLFLFTWWKKKEHLLSHRSLSGSFPRLKKKKDVKVWILKHYMSDF